jgi:tetratricopeptide (TPR) repeat protein
MINWKALITMLVIGLSLGAVALGLTMARQGQSHGSVEREIARLVDAGRDDLAIRLINQYLAQKPDEPVILQHLARLLARRAETLEQLLGASRVYERLSQVASGQPKLQDATQRELAEVYIKYSDALHATALYRGTSELAANESRYRAAEEISKRLVEEHPEDAESHRLLAMAKEGLAVPGDDKELEGAVREYAKSLELEPKHVETSERLAALYRIRLKDNAKAEAVLDRLAAASEDPIEPLLARYRYFREAAQTDRSAEAKAGKALDEALRHDPKNLLVRLAAAEHALRNGKAMEAREHVRALPESDSKDFRLSIMKGLVEFAQEHPQEALEQWRQGLVQMQGTHAELTWWLAYVQLRLGRVEQAAPLVAQYRRLVESNEDPALQFLEALSDERGGRPKQAVLALEQIRDKAPGRLREEIIVALGRCYEALGEDELAMQTYRLAEQSAPGAALPRLAITSLLLAQGPDEAVAELRNAVQVNEPAPDPDLLIALAKAIVMQQATRPQGSRTWAEVDGLLNRLETEGVSNSTLAILRADRVSLAGRPLDGVTVLEAAAADDPINPTIWVGLASKLSEAGKNDEALAALDRGSKPEAAGDSATLRLIRARLLVAMGRGREAQTALVSASEAMPLDQQASLWEALGRLRATQGNLEGSRTAYERWAQISPGTPNPALALLQIALTEGDRTAAERHLGRLFELGGGIKRKGADDLNYRLGRAMLLYRFAEGNVGSTDSDLKLKAANDLKEATDLTDKIIKDAPKLPSAYMLKGQILESHNQNEAAAVAYREAWERGGEGALPRLLDVMVRLRQFNEIEKLSGPQNEVMTGALSVAALLNAGESERAVKLLDQMVADPARTEAWRVRLLELAGKKEAVEALLQAQAERAAADDVTPWLQLIQVQVKHGRPASVLDATISKLLIRARTDRPDLLRAHALWSAGRLADADRVFEKVVVDSANDPTALADVSLHYESTGRIGRAAQLLEQALKVSPANRDAARQLAVQLSSQTSDPAAAARAWELVGGEIEPTDSADRLARAIVMVRSPVKSRQQQAIPALEALISDVDARTSVARAARDYLSRVLIAEGKPARAVELAAVSAESGEDAAAIALHAQALVAAGRFNEAETELNRLLELNPLDMNEPIMRAYLVAERAGPAGAPAALADAVESRGATPSAISLGRAAFDRIDDLTGPADSPANKAADRIAAILSAKEPSLGWMKARLLARTGHGDEALAACQTTVEASEAANIDRYQACRVAVGIASDPNHSPDVLTKVAKVIDTALARTPDDPALLTLHALIQHSRGQYQHEVATYRRILALWPAGRPETDQLENNLAWVLSEGTGHADEALKLADALIARHGEDGRFLCTRGVILIRLGQAVRAIPDLEKAVQAEPTNGRRLLHLARAYRTAGRDEQFHQVREQLRRVGLLASDCDPYEWAEYQTIVSQT